MSSTRVDTNGGKKRRWVWRLPLMVAAGSLLGVALFRFVPPVITPLMLIRWVEGRWSGRAVGISAQWRSLADISPHLLRAVIASEDQRFFQHRGFDWQQLDKALAESKHRRRSRGASTISMQTARSVFLWQGRNWLRKGLEAYFTFLIEVLWPKARILEVYLNVAEWGPGIYGAESAARAYFGRSAKQLTPGQAALLAGVLPNPHRWSPAKPTAYVQRRQRQILRQMQLIGPLPLGHRR